VIAGDERGILRIGTVFVGQARGQRQGRGQHGQTGSRGAVRSRPQAGRASSVEFAVTPK
jgi:hypothetical protein